ncbi:AidA/PixA family protein [Arcicella aquatica]|uniref:AidA/PixA family protein n=1 Tax=Arcicella aquatica TaxID=217141 RepID=A0ABU5QNS2_9BACT|nr:AidA/PixA family protein [Arcicella aquatica]MEA5258732.1 AidA/PixA family protein [Arcicella aquatica]
MNTIVNINIIVFTEQLIKDYPEPSQDPSNPTQVANSCVYVVKFGQQNKKITGFVGEHLNINASKDLQINFFMSSETSNYDTPVILYEMNLQKSIEHNPLQLKMFPKVKTIAPKSFNPLVCETIEKDFWFYTGFFNKHNKSEYGLRFSVYSDENLNILGYFQFNLSLSIG